MIAVLHPKRKPNERHWYAYDVVFDGELLSLIAATLSMTSLASCWPKASKARSPSTMATPANPAP